MRAKLGVLIAGLSVSAVAAAIVWRGTLRTEILRPGPVRLLGVGVFRGDRDFPAEFGRTTGYSTTGNEPLALYMILPPSARNLPGSDEFGIHGQKAMTATLIAPNGSSAPILFQHAGDRNGAMAQIRRDYPPELPYLDVEVKIPGERTTRWRIHNLPGGSEHTAFGQPRTADGAGANRAIGRAWWERGKKPGWPPVLITAVSMPDFYPRAGETCEISRRLRGPFSQRGSEPYVASGSMTGLNRGEATAEAINTPYAGYVDAVKVEGEARRYRVFDETLDFGELPLRRRQSDFGRDGDAEPALRRPLNATTPGGLRLVLPARTTGGDNFSYGTGMNVSFRAEADPQTLAQGLPADMAALAKRGHKVEVQVAPVDRRGGWFNDVRTSGRPDYVTFSDVSPKTIKRYRFRLRVRRRIPIEEAPFRLVLPVARTPRKTIAPFYEGRTIFMVDPRTLEPLPPKKA